MSALGQWPSFASLAVQGLETAKRRHMANATQKAIDYPEWNEMRNGVFRNPPTIHLCNNRY